MARRPRYPQQRLKARLFDAEDFDRLGDARGVPLTLQERAGVEQSSRQFIEALIHVRGAPTEHAEQLLALERWASDGRKRLEQLSGPARLASKIMTWSPKEQADRTHIDWLVTIEARARNGSKWIKRNGKLSGVAWEDPDVFLIVYVAKVLGLRIRCSVNPDTNEPCGPFFDVMATLYAVMRRREREGCLPWSAANKLIGAPSPNAIRGRIRKAQRSERTPEPRPLTAATKAELPPIRRPKTPRHGENVAI